MSRVAIVMIMVLVVAVGVASADGVGLPRTASGCMWPTGIADNPERGVGFLAVGPEEYLPGAFHLGKDIVISGAHPTHAKIGDPVYAVADGEVVLINASNTWGTGNCAVLVRHVFSGGPAIVCYGHLQTSSVHLVLHQRVSAGGQIGKLGLTHLHFGVHPGELPSVNLYRLGMGQLPPEWPSDNPLATEGWVDPVQWITAMSPINEDTRADSCPAWDPDANRLYFVRHERGTQKVWVCDQSGGYARPIWTIPANQEVEQLLSYQGQPLAVLWDGNRSTVCQANRAIRTLSGRGWLSQALYSPGTGIWTWISDSVPAVRFWPDGQDASDIGSECAGINISCVRELARGGKERQIPIIVKAGPKLPWNQFSWTCFTDFRGEFPVVVLKSGELYWVGMQAKYQLPDYSQDHIVEFWTNKAVSLTRTKTHGSVAEFTMSAPQRLFATSRDCIWRLDFDGTETRWCQVTGGNKVVRQKFKS